MNKDWLELIACPVCQHDLHFINGSDSSLVCQSCGGQYAIWDRIPRLVPAEDLENLIEFNQRYRKMRLSEGWRPMTAEQTLKLPFSQPPGYPGIYWVVRRESFTALKNWLANHGPQPPMGPAADLGAGVGWMSDALARSGFRVVALDSNLDESFGLGAARTYLGRSDFLIVQGDLNKPPFQDGKFGLVLFNASMHYAKDLTLTLNRTRQALHPEGRVVIMDSPVARMPQPGRGVGGRIFGSQELQDALVRAGFQTQWFPVRRGVRWWIAQGLRLARGGALFSLPIIVAEKV
jgi:uncharacterized protein YbaR (Trm112 family)